MAEEWFRVIHDKNGELHNVTVFQIGAVVCSILERLDDIARCERF